MKPWVAVTGTRTATEWSQWPADVRAVAEGLVDLVVFRAVSARVGGEVERALEPFQLGEAEGWDCAGYHVEVECYHQQRCGCGKSRCGHGLVRGFSVFRRERAEGN